MGVRDGLRNRYQDKTQTLFIQSLGLTKNFLPHQCGSPKKLKALGLNEACGPTLDKHYEATFLSYLTLESPKHLSP